MFFRSLIATGVGIFFLFPAAGFSVAEPFYKPLHKMERQWGKKSTDPRVQKTLQRMKPLLRHKSKRYLLVNIPAFELYAVERDAIIMKMKVIAGRENSPTPVLSDSVTDLVLNPRWHLPQKMALAKIPLLRRNPSILGRKRMELFANRQGEWVSVNPKKIDWSHIHEKNFPYKITQKPGPTNPMGRIKFILSNDFQIFLHDTPQKQLFSRKSRAYSSGCIRVEKPWDLAAFLLKKDLSSAQADFKKILKGGEEERVNLPMPVPVFFVYWTAGVEEGEVRYYNDIYHRD